MPRPLPSAWLDAIVQYCDSVADGVTTADLVGAFQPVRSERTVRYWLSVLVTQGRLAKFGVTRASRYWSPWRVPPRVVRAAGVHRTVHTIADPTASFPPEGPPPRASRKVKRTPTRIARSAAAGSAGLRAAQSQPVAIPPPASRAPATPPAMPGSARSSVPSAGQRSNPEPQLYDTSAYQAKFAEMIPLMIQSGVRPVAARHFIEEASIGESDPRTFTAAFFAELNGLTEATARGYGVSPVEFRKWKAGWR